jgi:uncharacterized integral membrane protein
MMRFLANDERGAVTVDWVALTSGLILLGIMAVYAIMNNSADNLLAQFDQLDDHYQKSAIIIAEAIKQTNFSK